MRSKIVVRYTTDPADLGYGGRKSDWLHYSGEVVGVHRAAHYGQELRKKFGDCYYAINYKHNGQDITRDDLLVVISEAEYRAYNKKRHY